MIKLNSEDFEKLKARFTSLVPEEYIDSLKGKTSLITQRLLEKYNEETLYMWFDNQITEFENGNGTDNMLKFIIASSFACVESPMTRLYHGSDNGDIKVLEPRLSNHDKEYVYATNSMPLALLYSYNPIERPGGFYTYRFDNDGNLIYDEYFPNQLEKIYKGHGGYVYELKDNSIFTQMEKMPWIYLSEKKAKVYSPKYIPDIYVEILRLESLGKITINRYENMTDKDRERWRDIVIKDIEMKELKENTDSSYAQFLHEHFPDLI